MSVTSLSPTQGLQNFVDESSNQLVATATAGTPAAGTFYSSISGRSSIPDMSQDLKARMGIDRLQFTRIVQMQNEFGPNGERVFAAMGDSVGQLRYVGQGWVNNVNSSGNQIYSSGNATDYVEVTFYGTGLNALMIAANTGNDWRVSVDGGAEGSNITYGAYSSILVNRGTYPNQILPIIHGLALGIHTVKIRNNNASVPSFDFQGFEVVNNTSNVLVNPGTSYVNGKKQVLPAQSAIAYNSVVTGTRGGRVLVYQNGSGAGSIAQAFNAVNASSAFLTSADHTNEEMIRQYHFLEFGANRSDDYMAVLSNATGGFTLDDGTTTLIGQSIASASQFYGPQGIGFFTSGYIQFSFTGCGLDLLLGIGGGSASTAAVLVDGASVGTITLPAANQGVVNTKIASGLPYGHHTIRLTYGSTGGLNVFAMRVFHPKKPSLPDGAIELADYNVLANYAWNSTTVNIGAVSTGVMNKTVMHEAIYVNGTGGADWSISTVDAASLPMGFRPLTTHTGAYAELTFFGTGIELHGVSASSETSSVLVQLDNFNGSGLRLATAANFSGLTSNVTAQWTFNTSTAVLNTNNASTVNNQNLSISGLPLGIYRIRYTNQAVASFQIHSYQVITPIHVIKNSTPFQASSAMPVGSQGISDNRKLSPLKGKAGRTKNMVIAEGVANASTSSSIYVPVPDMTATIVVPEGGRLDITFNGTSQSNTAGGFADYAIFLNGVQLSGNFIAQSPSSGQNVIINLRKIVQVPAGVHNVTVMWHIGAGTQTSPVDVNSSRSLILVED